MALDRGRQDGKRPSAAGPDSLELIDGYQLASLLRCSTRHVHRLARSRRMPSPLRLGTALRWRRIDIDQWINQGCPAGPTASERGDGCG